MNKESLKFLKKLLTTASPSGFESNIQNVWTKYIKNHVEYIQRDYHGNVIGSINLAASLGAAAPKLLFAGHCDELGLMVVHIDDNGFIYVKGIGGHDPAILPGSRVKIQTSDTSEVYGVIGKKSIHAMTPDERKAQPKLENIWIDLGAKSKADVEKLGVKIGDAMTLNLDFKMLEQNFACARFDDKIGAFCVAEILRLLNKKTSALPCSVFGVSTVQEEVGLRGAQTSTYGVSPDIGIAIDVTVATDYPTMNVKKDGLLEVGKGPVISRGANFNHHVVKLLIATAEKFNIPYQIDAQPGGTGTDANAIQLTGAGVATGLVSIASRYLHTPSEVLSLDDVDNTIKLLVGFTELIKDKTDFIQ